MKTKKRIALALMGVVYDLSPVVLEPWNIFSGNFKWEAGFLGAADYPVIWPGEHAMELVYIGPLCKQTYWSSLLGGFGSFAFYQASSSLLDPGDRMGFAIL